MENIDRNTVNSFGDEWSRFDQADLSREEIRERFDEYFSIFPWSSLPEKPEGFDMGCGSGRWARLVAPQVGTLHCIDPSSAISVAQDNLKEFDNVKFHQSSLDDVFLEPGSQDFGYSLGVLHHVPDTTEAIKSCVKLLKSGAPLLLYLYYAFDNRPLWFRWLWRLSDLGRRAICRLPGKIKNVTTDIIACLVYWPLARLARIFEWIGFQFKNIPLSYYRNYSFYSMRTDAHDRFGTRLERRFTRQQIEKMMSDAGLINIRFSEGVPYWVVVGYKKPDPS